MPHWFGYTKVEDLSDDQIDDIQDEFSNFDYKEDGTIATEDLGNLLRALQQSTSPEEVNKAIERVDTDGSGFIDFPEFLVLFIEQMKPSKNDYALRNALLQEDPDRHGFLTPDQLRSILSNHGGLYSPKEIDEKILEAHNEIDGYINYDEFVNKLYFC